MKSFLPKTSKESWFFNVYTFDSVLKSNYGPMIYGFFQGLLVASAYLILKSSGAYGGLPEFSIAVATIGIIHCGIAYKNLLNFLCSRKLIVRGILLGTSQIFACLALANGAASTAVISGTLGGIFGVILGNIVLKERLKPYKYIAMVVCFVGSSLNPAMASVTFFAVLSGLIKGTGSVLTRNIMKEQTSAFQTVGVTCSVAAVISISASFILNMPLLYNEISFTYVLYLVAAASLIQYSVCFLYKISDTQRASSYTLSRIPFIVCLEWIFYDSSPPKMRVLSASIILAGALLLALFDMNESRKNKSSYKSDYGTKV